VTALAAANAQHPIIRSIAMTSLGQFAERSGPGRRLVTALDDSERTVRISALVSLANSARGQLAREDQVRFHRVSRESAEGARLRERDARWKRGELRAFALFRIACFERVEMFRHER
jgi:hypothetical protein